MLCCNIKKYVLYFFILVMSNSLGSCDSERAGGELKSGSSGTNDSTGLANGKSSTGEILEFPLIKYNHVLIKDAAMLKSIRQKYNHPKEWHAGWKTLMTLNRKEWRFFRTGQTIIVPDTILEDLRAYSLFPLNYPAASSIPKLIVVSPAYQCYGAYEYGKLVRFVPVNSGKEKTPTFPGRYALVWKERLRRSSLDSTWIMPFTYNFHGEAGSAFHQFEMPGYPASHSCVRQLMEDAEWLFGWGEGQKLDEKKKPIRLSGTPVIIIDHYDFNLGRNGLFTKLNSNKDTILELPPDPMAIEEALIPIIQIPQSSRGRLPNRKRFEEAEKVLREKGIIRPNVTLTPSVNFNAKRRAEEAEKLKKGLLPKSNQAVEKPSTPSVKKPNPPGFPKF